jgi:predicted RNA polymerase sigma factor
MADRLKDVREQQGLAKSQRKKGDALRKMGRTEEARAAYQLGVTALTGGLDMLQQEEREITSARSPLGSEQKEVLSELVEMFGARGGLLQRLGLLGDALDNYRKGAALETRFALPSTYNRLNALKQSLLLGAAPLNALEPQIQALATLIKAALDADKSLSDQGWAWADLGDCLALLGNPVEARKAYSTFIAKAEIKSPERALDVLQEIAAKLVALADPDALRLQEAIKALQGGLTLPAGAPV